MTTLVTGVAGFIGMHTAERLLRQGVEIVGIDNLNNYYDPTLKTARLAQLMAYPRFRFETIDVADQAALGELFARNDFDDVVHLAAQAGVRYSITNPHAYGQANLVGFLNMLECCRQREVRHLVYASSSSVYGGSTRLPLSESDSVDHPVSLYAATKKANELMAHTYSHLYHLPTTGLRFFTVYGPWGRPDMAPYLFTDAIANDRPIKVFNHGRLRRDFTYIDDIVTGVLGALARVPGPDERFDAGNPDPSTSAAPYRVFNIGNSESIELERFIRAIESALGKKAVREMLPMQPGDVTATHANTRRIEAWSGFRSTTTIEDGIRRFVDWYMRYHTPSDRVAAAAPNGMHLAIP